MKWILFLAFISFGVSFAAEVQAPPPDFSVQWLATPMYTVKHTTGTFQLKVLERFVVAGGSNIPVGNITYFKTPKRKGDTKELDSDKIARKIGKVFAIKTWYKRKIKNASVYEGTWDAPQFYVRIFISGDEKSTSYSVSMLRKAYADTVAPESEYLQEKLSGTLGHTSPWLEKMVTRLGSGFLIQQAFADETDLLSSETVVEAAPKSVSTSDPKVAKLDFENKPTNPEKTITIYDNKSLPELPHDYTRIAVQPTSFTNDLTQLNQVTLRSHTTTTTTTGSAGRVAGALSSLPNISSNLSVTIPTVGGISGVGAPPMQLRPNSSLSAAAAGIAKAGGLIGLAIALTGQPALGVMVAIASAAVAGVIQAGDYLVDAITHKTEYEELFKAFTEAMEQYGSHKGKIEEIEGHLSRNMQLQTLIKQLGGKEKAIQIISALDIQHSVRIEELKEEAKKNTTQDRTACYLEAGSLSEEKAALESLLPLIRSYSEDSLCEDLKKVISALIKAEDGLQVARNQILSQVGKQVWASKLNEKYGKLIERNTKDFEKAKKAESTSKKEAQKLYDKQYKAAIQPKVEKAYKACLDRKKMESKKLLAEKEDKKICREMSENPDSELAKEFGYAETFRTLKSALSTLLTDAASHQRVLNEQDVTFLNPLVHAATFREYNKTFETLMDEQLLSNTNKRLKALLERQDTIENSCIGVKVKQVYEVCLDRLKRARHRSLATPTDMNICWEAVNDPSSDLVKEFGYGQSLRHVHQNNKVRRNPITNQL